MTRTIIAVLGFVIAGGVFFLYTQPTYDNMQTIQAQNSEYDQALSKAAELQQLKQALLSRYNSFNPSDISKLQSMLPDQINNIQLILNLDNMASHDGMALQNVVINDPQASQAGSGSSAVDTISAGNQKYQSLTMQFTTHGTYDQFKQFLDDMESSLQLVDLVTLSIAPDSGTTGPGGMPAYTYDMTIRTYWLQ